MVLNKPANLPVHPGPSGGASVEDSFPALSRRRAGPWLVHRLDADTAGCLLVAMRRAALLAAQAEFAAGRAEKLYWAVVRGGPEAARGQIALPLLKRNTKQGWHMTADPSGDPAVTDWQVLGRAAGLSWLELRPRTGRTHQLRLHCAASGFPILGDTRYGAGETGGLHLLARELHLALEPKLHAMAPPPAHMRAALRQCGAGS